VFFFPLLIDTSLFHQISSSPQLLPPSPYAGTEAPGPSS
jgi:hypothetical protein